MAFLRIKKKGSQAHDTKHGPKCKHEHIIKSRLDDESEHMGKLSQETLQKKKLGRKAIYKVWIYIHYLYGYFTEIPLFYPESTFIVCSLLKLSRFREILLSVL